MPRIAHAVPMKAYDHVANLLKQQNGGNGAISRAEAAALVEKLEKEGQGTEALAVNNIFKLIDARDAAPGARVTGYDLERDRQFVQEKLLENRDINKNGYARDEIAKMSPTGRALVELGQVLSMEARSGRIGYATPEAGLNHITALLKGAAHKDSITSRADADALVKQLNKEGRGTEALAAATFFAFIDFRDNGGGARVTAADIDKASSYAAERMLRAKDHNQNGYSAEEIKAFSKSAKAFLLIGQMIEAGILKAA